MFETVINLEESTCEVVLEKEEVDLDGLNYLAGKIRAPLCLSVVA